MLLVTLTLLLALAACSSSGAPRGSDVVEDYVEAMADFDVEAAWSLRCARFRRQPTSPPAFEAQLRELVELNGPIGLHEVRDHPAGLEYELTVSGEPVGETLVAGVEDEGGRLCLTAPETAASRALAGEIDAALTDLGPTTARPRDLMPDSVGRPQHQQVEDGPARDLKPGEDEVEGWVRTCAHRRYGGSTVRAVRYRSADAARGAAVVDAQERLRTGVERFEIEGVEGALGVRALGYAWLFVQPPTHGPFVDFAYLQLGDTVVRVTVGHDPTRADHSAVTLLAQKVLHKATR